MDKALEAANQAIELDPDVRGAHRLLGRIYFGMLRNGGGPDLADKAIEAFRGAVRLDPMDLDSRSSLARLLIGRDENSEAATHLEVIINMTPNSYHDMFLLAQIKRKEGDRARALELLKQSIQVQPDQPQVLESLIGMLREDGKFGELVQVLSQAVKNGADNVHVRLQFAEALARNGMLDEAKAGFQKILDEGEDSTRALLGLAMVEGERKEFDEAERLLDQVLASKPQNVGARYTLASLYEDKRDYARAAEAWKSLIDLPEGSYPPARRAEFAARLGFAYQELSDFDEAVASFRRARELSDGNVRFDIFLVQGLLAGAQLDAASAELETALGKHPDNRRLQVLESRLLDARGQGEESISRALALAEAEPGNGMLAGAVVEAYQRQGSYADAEDFLRGRLKQATDDIGLRFQLAAMLERQKKFDEAEAIFEQIVEKQPENAAALNYLGYMLADQSVRLEESLTYIQRAVELDPYNGAYLDSLGWVYFKMGKLDLAEENLLRAIERLRITGVVYDHLGDLYFEKGAHDEAVRFWQKALDQDDDDLERERVARKIECATEPR